MKRKFNYNPLLATIFYLLSNFVHAKSLQTQPLRISSDSELRDVIQKIVLRNDFCTLRVSYALTQKDGRIMNLEAYCDGEKSLYAYIQQMQLDKPENAIQIISDAVRNLSTKKIIDFQGKTSFPLVEITAGRRKAGVT